MDIMRVAKIISIISALYSLTAGQEQQLNNYVKDNLIQWKMEMRRDEEIEAYIKAEANRITSGS